MNVFGVKNLTFEKENAKITWSSTFASQTGTSCPSSHAVLKIDPSWFDRPKWDILSLWYLIESLFEAQILSSNFIFFTVNSWRRIQMGRLCPILTPTGKIFGVKQRIDGHRWTCASWIIYDRRGTQK